MDKSLSSGFDRSNERLIFKGSFSLDANGVPGIPRAGLEGPSRKACSEIHLAERLGPALGCCVIASAGGLEHGVVCASPL